MGHQDAGPPPYRSHNPGSGCVELSGSVSTGSAWPEPCGLNVCVCAWRGRGRVALGGQSVQSGLSAVGCRWWPRRTRGAFTQRETLGALLLHLLEKASARPFGVWKLLKASPPFEIFRFCAVNIFVMSP